MPSLASGNSTRIYGATQKITTEVMKHYDNIHAQMSAQKKSPTNRSPIQSDSKANSSIRVFEKKTAKSIKKFIAAPVDTFNAAEDPYQSVNPFTEIIQDEEEKLEAVEKLSQCSTDNKEPVVPLVDIEKVHQNARN